jgi:hypothetical protein
VGSNTSSVALRVVGGDEKGTQGLGVYLGHPVPRQYKYGDLALQVGGVSNLRLSIYGSTALVDFGRFFSVLIHTQTAGLLGRGIRPSQGRYLHTEQHKHRINAYSQPCLEWDSNPRFQCSSGRRKFMP